MNRLPEEGASPADSQRIGLPALRRHLASPEVRIGAVVALTVVAGLVVWLLARGDDETKTITATGPAAVSAQDLAALPSTVGHPVYWAGPRLGFTYELTRTSDDRIYIRYLPDAARVGADRPYLTIGTYPVSNALAAVRALATRLHVKPATLGDGGVAVQDTEQPTSVYLAYPGSHYQVEVYDPSPTRARRLVLSGGISALGPGTGPTRAAAAQPKVATIQQLRALEPALGHPVYWVGTQRSATYELTETTDGRIYIRYLPKGRKVGDPKAHTTVGTYPLPNAVEAVRAIAKHTNGATFSIPDGGLAVVDQSHPTSVYVAFQGSNYQIEVFDPSPARARRLVTSGLVAPVH